jgi:hypothetical protein
VVDEYTFADKEAELRPVVFGAAPVPAATLLALPDRTGFLYHPEFAGKTLYMGVVPYDQGLSRTWALGPSEDDQALLASLREALQDTTFSGDHPVTPDQLLAYYVWYRPTHPGVLGSGCGCLCLAVAAFAVVGTFALPRTRKRADDA